MYRYTVWVYIDPIHSFDCIGNSLEEVIAKYQPIYGQGNFWVTSE